MDTTRHTGRVVLVTGAAYGIGRATALRFAREGASVYGIDMDEEGLARAADEFGAADVRVSLRRADVTVRGDVDASIEAIVAAHGRVDVVANVAGIMDFFLPAHEVDDETWDRVLAVNVTGPMLLCRRVLPLMMAQHSGSEMAAAAASPTRTSSPLPAHGLGSSSPRQSDRRATVHLQGAYQAFQWITSSTGRRCTGPKGFSG